MEGGGIKGPGIAVDLKKRTTYVGGAGENYLNGTTCT